MKTYIALVLTFIFVAKFLAVDANGLNVLFSGSEITFVNPHCKKRNSLKKLESSTDYSQQERGAHQMIYLNGQCNIAFQFESFTWSLNDPKAIVTLNDNVPSALSYRYLESVSPPPRLT
ncbi:hypothetical protein LCGC14_1769940 [marine sediment metagenome]|uniref:Uncharacterized protein n=1 Tax=marine sediment metagenome TaxID=412755 RepID=A0A0F9GYL6_9ZZZZ